MKKLLIILAVLLLSFSTVAVVSAGPNGNGSAQVPEPSTFIMFGAVLIGAMAVKKVKRIKTERAGLVS